MECVEFCTGRGFTGRANTTVLQISANYPGAMNCGNRNFVETVCHELIHYNGTMNHGKQFWDGLRWLLSRTLDKLKEQNELQKMQ